MTAQTTITADQVASTFSACADMRERAILTLKVD